MTDRFEEVQQLKRIEKLAKSEPIESMYYWNKWKYHMTVSSWLIEVAQCFQPGDDEVLDWILEYLCDDPNDSGDPMIQVAETLMHRLLRAAKIMEEKE